MRQILLTLLLLTVTLFANDARLDNYPRAQKWEKDANTNADSAYNLAYIYQTKIKDYEKAIELYKRAYKLDKRIDSAVNIAYVYSNKLQNYNSAIEWYKIGVEMGDSDAIFNLANTYNLKLNDYENAIVYYKKAIDKGDRDAPVSLALLYKKLHQYDDAIFYYKKAYEIGEIKAAYGLGYLYIHSLKDGSNAIIWYKKAAKEGYAKAINNLAYVYYNKKDNVTASAYILATIEYGFGGKKDTLNYLKNDWKIDKPTLKKAYKLQLKLDIPKHYRGGIE